MSTLTVGTIAEKVTDAGVAVDGVTLKDGGAVFTSAVGVTGNTTITSGNLVIGTSGNGIDFSAVSNASGMTSELLDSYEEGNWTPLYKGATSAGTYTFTEQQGFYIKVGGLVTAWFSLTNITDSSEGSGQVLIEGLPFTNNHPSGFNGEGIGTAQVSGFDNLDGDYINIQAEEGTSRLRFNKQTGSGNTTSQIPVTDRNTDGADLRGCVHYRAS